MSASSSDSWILIALTILVVLLLFYLSKKMICNSYGSSNSEDSTTSPSSSTTSTSTSFSDYLYHGGYDGRSSLDLVDAAAAAATASSNGTSPDIDDLAIDIADSLNCPGHHHHHPNHHYRVDNGCSCDNYNCNNNNNNHGRNNLDLGNSVAGNGRGMSVDDGGNAASAIGSRNSNNNNNSNRGMDFSGSPTTSSTLPAATTGSHQQPILSPISIIAGPAFDRKTMLETQLRNQIAKIVQAEREIQRLVLLLSLEQRQGYDAENTMLAAARASLLQHYQRYPQFYNHLRRVIPPILVSTTLGATTPMTSESLAETSTEPVVDVTVSTSRPLSNCNNNHNNNISTPSQEHDPNNVVTSHARPEDLVDADHHEYVSSETTSRENHQQHCLCHRHSSHHHHHHNENSLDYHANPNPIQQNPLQHGHHQPILSCGLDDSSIATFHRQSNSGCNLCLIGGSRGRRMLMLRRMLLSPSFPPTANVNTASGAATTAYGGFLARPANPLSCDLHYLPQQPIPEPQSGFSNYSHNHQHDNYPPPEDDDPPPLYEECIRSEMSSNHDEEYNQNRHNNNFSPDTTRSSNKSQKQPVKTLNV